MPEQFTKLSDSFRAKKFQREVDLTPALRLFTKGSVTFRKTQFECKKQTVDYSRLQVFFQDLRHN